MASRALHYRDGHEAGELRLNKSVFTSGWVLTGGLPARDRRKASTAAADQSDGRSGRRSRGSHQQFMFRVGSVAVHHSR